MSEEAQTPLNHHHPGAIDIDTYLRATGVRRSLFRRRSTAVAAVVALALGSAAAGNLAPRWTGDHLKGGDLKRAVEVVADPTASEWQQETALTVMQCEAESAIEELLKVAATDGGATGNKASIRARKLVEKVVDTFQRSSRAEGRVGDRASRALQKLFDRYIPREAR